MYDAVVLLLDDGVIALANFISDGIKAVYYIDGIEFEQTFADQEYEILQDL